MYIGTLIYSYSREHMYENVIRDYDIIYQDTDSALITHEEYVRLLKNRPDMIGE